METNLLYIAWASFCNSRYTRSAFYLTRTGCTDLGPVVQIFVSLTSSLRHQLVMLSKCRPHKQIYFYFLLIECENPLHGDQQKITVYLYSCLKFNESLTDDVVNFEQLGPDFCMLSRILFILHHIT